MDMLNASVSVTSLAMRLPSTSHVEIVEQDDLYCLKTGCSLLRVLHTPARSSLAPSLKLVMLAVEQT